MPRPICGGIPIGGGMPRPICGGIPIGGGGIPIGGMPLPIDGGGIPLPIGGIPDIGGGPPRPAIGIAYGTGGAPGKAPCGIIVLGAGPPRPRTGPPASPVGGAGTGSAEGGRTIPRPAARASPGPLPPAALGFSSIGGGPSTDRETTHSPRIKTKPRVRFSSRSSFNFPLGVIFLNSSQSPRIMFMCLSKAMNLPTSVRLS